MAASKLVKFRNKQTGITWEMDDGSEAAKRCRRLKLEFDEVKPEKSG